MLSSRSRVKLTPGINCDHLCFAAMVVATVILTFFARSLVQLLLSSNVWRYLDFIAVQEAFMHTGSAILEVPCSKKTLLLNKNLAAKEKRQLMKLLQSCMVSPTQADAGAASGEGGTATTAAEAADAVPFGETLSATYKFSENVCNYVIHAIAGVTPDVTTAVGMEAVRRYERCRP